MDKQYNYVNIMDLPFINVTREELLREILIPNLKNNHKTFLVTANPEIVMRAKEDKKYEEVIKKADFIIPDGAGILLAAKYKKEPLKERIAGFDLMVNLLQFGEEHSLSCYLLGAKESTNKKVVEHVRRHFPNIKIAGHHHGFFGNSKKIVDEIKETRPDLVFVALGMPKQENWIMDNYHHFDKGLYMGVGGSFDTLVGEVKRAPESWIKLNLEWLYRLIQQPFRLKRILKAFQFIIKVIFKRE